MERIASRNASYHIVFSFDSKAKGGTFHEGQSSISQWNSVITSDNLAQASFTIILLMLTELLQKSLTLPPPPPNKNK